MRRVFLDTETTGLSPEKGHRIVEVAAIAYDDRMPIARSDGGVFHKYLNPQREVEAEALAIHKLSNDFLSDKPLFVDIADDLAEFLRGCELIIHNADFDKSFLNSELKRCQKEPLEKIVGDIVCSLKWSRANNPNIRGHSLDSLCDHFGVNKEARTAHSALLDTELLAKVYFQMTLRQGKMNMQARLPQVSHANSEVLVVRASAAETAAHLHFLEEMQKEKNIVPLFSRPPPAPSAEEPPSS